MDTTKNTKTDPPGAAPDQDEVCYLRLPCLLIFSVGVSQCKKVNKSSYSYQRAVFDVMSFPIAQLTDNRHFLDAVATDATSAAAAVARGVDERQAHEPGVEVTEVSRLRGRGAH